jgi:hypothetical protein
LVGNIVVHSVLGEDRNGDQKQIGHKCEIIFKLRVVKDKFKWIDDTNKKLGYEISEGRKKLTTKTVNLQKGRGKKKVFNRGYKDRVNYKHSLETIGNGGEIHFFERKIYLI